MAKRFTPKEILEADAVTKPEGFDDDAQRLMALANNSGRWVVRAHLDRLGVGDKKNRADPVMLGTVPRLAQALGVLYAQPALRVLVRKNKQGLREPLSPIDPGVLAWTEVQRRMQYPATWARIDFVRQAVRQCVVVFSESTAHRAIVARVFEPHNVARAVTPGAADILESDEAFCLRLSGGDATDATKRIYQLWNRSDEGEWWLEIVDENGETAGDPPYTDENGAIVPVPVDTLPALLVSDEPLLGRAWLPIPQQRLTTSLAIDALANDLGLLVKNEAHNQRYIKTDRKREVPTEIGPDKLWTIPSEAEVGVVETNPKISESREVIELLQSALALSESLPGDAFSAQRVQLTGAALRASERDLDRRRRNEADAAADQERRGFEKVAALVEAFGAELGLDPVPRDAELLVVFGSRWEVVDTAVAQTVSLNEVAAGTKSLLEHAAESRGITVEDMRLLWPSIQADRASFRAPGAQNPAAIAAQGGPNPALGPGSATKTPGAMNPKASTSTEGASLSDAVQRRAGQTTGPVASG